MRKLVTALTLCATLGACTDTGTTAPGQLGVNNTTGSTSLGAGPGGLIGTSLGRQLDADDQTAMSRTTQTALETAPPDQALPWQDPQNGHYGQVIPGQYYQTADGQYCREFQQTVTIGGQTQQDYGKACRQPDGSWRIVQ